ncbi:hypothetical protein Tco_1449764 [Tanacetum coccineum]
MLKRVSWATNHGTCRANTVHCNAGAESVGCRIVKGELYGSSGNVTDIKAPGAAIVIMGSRIYKEFGWLWETVMRTYRIIATEVAYWAPNIESMEVNSETNPRKERIRGS